MVTALQEADDGTISQYSTGTIDRRMPALPVVSPALNVSPSRPPASAPRRPSMSLVLDTDVSKPPLPSRPSTLLPTPLSPPVPPRVHGQATPPGARSPLNTSPALSRKPVNITVQDVPSKKVGFRDMLRRQSLVLFGCTGMLTQLISFPFPPSCVRDSRPAL